MEEQTIIEKKENPDSIEWRLATNKSVKVYGDASNPEDFKKRLNDAIKILKEVDREHGESKKE